jgi:type II secretory pathway pseudopilin PulG
MVYRMTPARAAALRRAQLISAQKRRKYGVKYQAKNVARQKITSAKLNKGRTLKYGALALTLASTGAAAYAGTKTPTYKYHKGTTKTTVKAYRGGKRGPAIKTYRKRVSPIIAHNSRYR